VDLAGSGEGKVSWGAAAAVWGVWTAADSVVDILALGKRESARAGGQAGKRVPLVCGTRGPKHQHTPSASKLTSVPRPAACLRARTAAGSGRHLETVRDWKSARDGGGGVRPGPRPDCAAMRPVVSVSPPRPAAAGRWPIGREQSEGYVST
jgi:hypothetical protein